MNEDDWESFTLENVTVVDASPRKVVRKSRYVRRYVCAILVAFFAIGTWYFSIVPPVTTAERDREGEREGERDPLSPSLSLVESSLVEVSAVENEMPRVGEREGERSSLSFSLSPSLSLSPLLYRDQLPTVDSVKIPVASVQKGQVLDAYDRLRSIMVVSRMLEIIMESDLDMVCVCAPMINVTLSWISMSRRGRAVYHMLNPRVRGVSKQMSTVRATSPLDRNGTVTVVRRADAITLDFDLLEGDKTDRQHETFHAVESHCIQVALRLIHGIIERE